MFEEVLLCTVQLRNQNVDVFSILGLSHFNEKKGDSYSFYLHCLMIINSYGFSFYHRYVSECFVKEFCEISIFGFPMIF